MPTPKQARTTIETPFGTGYIMDHRGHETPKRDEKHARAEVAAIRFEKLVINRKDYGDMVLYVTRWHDSISVSPYSYGGVTSKAHDALNEFFNDCPPLEPFLDDLDEAGCRASRKHKLWYEIQSKLSSLSSNQYYPSEEGKLTDALLDEVLADITAQRAAGVHFSNIKES
jgi:hypothetical protein